VPYLRLLGRLLIAALFLYSGIQKLSAPSENFEEVLRMYEVFPEFSIAFLSHFVPLAEIVMGILLAIGLFTRQALLGALVFFFSFITVLSRALLLKIPLEDCGCFGGRIHLPLTVTLGMDIGFFILALLLYLAKPSAFSLDTALRTGSEMDPGSR